MLIFCSDNLPFTFLTNKQNTAPLRIPLPVWHTTAELHSHIITSNTCQLTGIAGSFSKHQSSNVTADTALGKFKNMAHISTVYGTYIPSGAHIYGYGKWCS
jgi:hypothetical protein